MSKKIKVFLLACVLMLMCCMGMTVMASEETKAEVMGHSLTITDTGISVNFYVDIQGLAENNVEVTLNNKKVEIPNETKEIIIDAKAYKLYVFTQPVAAKEMDDTVSLTITSGDKELAKDSYRVNDYVAEVQKGGYSLNFENLANAMTYYGEFAEVYFGYKGATNVTNEATSYISGVTQDLFDVDGYKASVNKENMPEGLKYYGTQLNLNSKITLRILFEIEEGYTASSYGNIAADGTDLGQLKKVGNYYCVDITGIGAAELGKGYTITCGGKDIITNCSVLTYARAVVKTYEGKDGVTDKQKSLLNVSKALYLYNQKAAAYVAKPATDVIDIFYNGTGFYAEPSYTNQVYLTADKEVTTVSEGNTLITALSQLNDSRTKGCTVWMSTAYAPSENETLTGPYVMRRYADNISVLNITGTATIASTVDGRLGEFVAQYPDGTSDVNITNAENGEVYVSGNLTVTGNAKTGVVKTSSADVTINADGLTAQGEVVFPNHTAQKLTGNGEASAITLVENGQGHFGAIETTNGLTLGSIICGCGDNVSEDPTHSCAWTTANNGLEAAYTIDWQPWSDNILPNVAGSYYLAGDITLARRGDITNGITVNLDLAGFTASGHGWNGGVYRVQKGTLNIADSSQNKTGTIKVQNATGGGNGLALYVWGNQGTSVANIFGGTLTAEGETGNNGTTVSIHIGTVNMYDGTIIPGTSTAGSNSVQVGVVATSPANFNVEGGTVKGEVLLYSNSANLSISKKAKVGVADGEKAYGISTASSTVTEPRTIACEDVAENAKVVLKNLVNLNVVGTGEASAITLLDNGQGHFGAIETTNGLTLGSIICGCGDNVSEDPTHSCAWTTANNGLEAAYTIDWQPWSDNILPNVAGSYYLTGNIALERRSDINGITVNLDLAGFTASGHGWNGGVCRVQKGTLNIADSSPEETGTIKATNTTSGGNGLVLYVWGGNGTSVANIFGGNFTAEGETGNNGTTVSIHLGTVNMYGGTIIPGASTEGSNSVQVGLTTGSTPTLNVQGGTIKGEVILYNDNANLSISKNAQVGIADGDKANGISTASTVTALRTIACADVTEKAKVVLKNLVNLNVTGTGEGSAFKLLDTTYRNRIGDDQEEGIGNLIEEAYMCVCGKMDGKYDHTDNCEKPATAWQPWNSDILPNVVGSYYLTGNITLARRSDINGITVNLDLAGFTASGHGWNGGVCRVQKGTLNIADSSPEKTGTIKVQNATNGGNGLALYVWGGNGTSVANIFGGTFTAEGETGNNGTTVSIHLGTVNMYGGTIIPGTSTEGSNSVQVGLTTGSTPTLNVEGGTIKGEVILYNDNANLSISKNAQVGIADAGKANGISTASTVTAPRTIACTDVVGQIVLKDSNNLNVSGTGEESSFKLLNITTRNTIGDDSEEGIGNLIDVAYMCVCGKMDGKYDHTDNCEKPATAWQPWSDNILPNVAGSYYLTGDITLARRGDITNGITVNLDLAGFTASGHGWNGGVYRVQKGTLNIADSSQNKTGAIKVQNATSGGNGLALYVWGNQGTSVANIFGGTLTAEGETGNNGTTVSIHIGTVNMYDGTIIPGTSTAGSNSVQVGVTATSPANFNVEGGTVKGEVLLYSDSANLSISKNAQVGIADGEKAYGISTASTVTAPRTIVCTDVAGQIVLKDTNNLTLSGTGDASKFTIIDKHNIVVNVDEDGTLGYEAYMCSCGIADGYYNHTATCEKPESAWQP